MDGDLKLLAVRSDGNSGTPQQGGRDVAVRGTTPDLVDDIRYERGRELGEAKELGFVGVR